MKLKNQLTDNTFSYDSLLYHYTSEESAHKILTNNTLKLSSLPKTNDPLEFEDLRMIMFNREIRARGLKFKYLQDLFTERKNTVRFACFSIDSQCIKNDDVSSQSYTGDLFFKGWARNRMWAQYADNHAGVCLVFDKNEFKNCFDVLANNSTEVLEDQKIKYTNDFSSYEKAMSNIEKEMNSKIDYRNFYLDGERRKFIFQKCEDFRDENEYRFALIDKDLKTPEDEKCVNFRNSLKAIILGPRFSGKLIKRLPKHVQCFKITWNCGCPNLM